MNNISTMVKCPECKKKHVYDKSNEFRPFCSERCKLIDFNGWASDIYAVPSEERAMMQNEHNYEED